MKTVEINQEVNIRLFSYKSFRHYGGREISTTTHICKAILVGTQNDHQKYIVTLSEPCMAFKVGHKIAVCENDFNI